VHVNREALRELFDYTTFTWASYGIALRSLPPDACLQQVEGSGWESLRQVLFHIAAGWDEWICELTGAEPQTIEAPDVTTWEQMEAIRSKLRPLLRRIIDESSEEQLHGAPHDTTGGPGRSRSDIIAHILLHERGHHGDVTTLLAALGAEVPMSDYLVYAWFRDRRK
jgi:uncharacterized damage-inducible protein DinB